MNQIDAARAAKRAYQKAWRSKNPDKVRAANKRYWIKRAEREAAEQAEQEREVQLNEG